MGNEVSRSKNPNLMAKTAMAEWYEKDSELGSKGEGLDAQLPLGFLGQLASVLRVLIRHLGITTQLP